MITSTQFDRVLYKKPFLYDDRPKMSNIVGIDSEATTDGKPFMFCTSYHEVIHPKELPDIFFTPRYENANFMIYNIKYDSGALLYHLDRENLHELWELGKTRAGLFKYTYIPHKLLRIQYKNDRVSFWDISQFYKMSLNNAAKKYLNKEKLDISTKNFTYSYIKRFWKSISKYCINDAVLTQELGEYLINKLDEFGITVTTLYSCASISFKYFVDNAPSIPLAYRYWKYEKKLLAFACDSYEGGKFEVTSRGFHPHVYEYDITSAYPYEIANLVDITNATVIYTNEYQPKAVYGFLRVFIDNSDYRHLPCGIMTDNVRKYPTGSYYLTITKEEYEYLIKIKVPVEIIDGAWLFVNRKRYPYRKIIKELFSIKDKYKGKDSMLYYVSKIIMNSFYGKCVQCTIRPDKKIQVGAGWNPIYGSVITANTRIKVSDIQNKMGDDCLAVHTDSVVTTRPLPGSIRLNGLGKFEYVIEGEGLLIACGMYQIDDICAFKGFKPKKRETWRSLFEKYPNRKRIHYHQLHVESWLEAMAKNHDKSRINVFANDPKVIDINCDTKRLWIERTNTSKLLSGIENSLPKIHIEIDQPEFWNRKFD